MNQQATLKKMMLTSLFKKHLVIALLFASSFSIAFAESNYGPVKNGETLYTIAKKYHNVESLFSVKQLSIAIFNLNPDAFISANINLLKKGAVLKIPDVQNLSKTSNGDADAQFRVHTHALNVIRVDAKHLKSAKQDVAVQLSTLKQLQFQINHTKKLSPTWLSLSKQLSITKRNLAKNKRKVARLKKLLLEKVTLKYTASIKQQAPLVSDNTSDAMANIDKRLNEIQTSLDSFNSSNLTLIEKVQELSKLQDRVKVLEESLGTTDDLVVQLKTTLDEMQQAIKQQSIVTKELSTRFEGLKSNKPDENNNNKDSDKTDDKDEICDPPVNTPFNDADNEKKQT